MAELRERTKQLDTNVIESPGMYECFVEMLCEEVAHVDAMLDLRPRRDGVLLALLHAHTSR